MELGILAVPLALATRSSGEETWSRERPSLQAPSFERAPPVKRRSRSGPNEACFERAPPIEGPDGTDPKNASFERAPPIEGPDGTGHLGISPGPGPEIIWRGDLVS